jgi:hypothetical protein
MTTVIYKQKKTNYVSIPKTIKFSKKLQLSFLKKNYQR